MTSLATKHADFIKHDFNHSSNTTSENSPCFNSTGIKLVFEQLTEYIKSPDFASFLEIKDVLALSQVCKLFRKIFDKDYISLLIRLGNLETQFRYLFWVHQVPCAAYFCQK